ncbi:RNA-directed DNA polymerase from mobile element jockey [Plakobranchus ocellatus]|uniref:RNA-directed DNA polymerase from mobile element jockey n=1 Tax=Plakobranchus ocellatus TaxID=259542 RepID=A0AAV3YZP5_9GAST|nr:RNA-directed DNA polymerase from mobile element jockey [Plakobranchus ocellatus]
MKERVDSTTMLREPSVNGSGADLTASVGGVGKLDSADIKMEVKDEDSGRKSTDSRPPSRKLPNGDTETIAVKSEDNNNKRVKLEKKADNGKMAAENGKPGSVGLPDSRKSSPHTPQPASHGPGSGASTPSTVSCGGAAAMGSAGPTPQQQQQQMMHQPQAGLVTSHEPPFMQQQSEIFVFSTALANQAAEGFHMEHPNTKAFLQVSHFTAPSSSSTWSSPTPRPFCRNNENSKTKNATAKLLLVSVIDISKNPLKSNFRPGGPQGMMGAMKGQQMGAGMIRMPGPATMNWGPHGPGSMEDPNMMGAGGPDGMMPNGQYGGPRMIRGSGPGSWTGGPPHMPGGCYPGGGPPMMEIESQMMPGGPSLPNNPLSISQVPDENLTMEQRQHRSKGLAQLTKIHQMLMGGNGSNSNGQSGCPPTTGGPPQQMGGPEVGPGMYPAGMMGSQQAMMQQQQQQTMMSQGGGMMPHHPGMMSPQQQQHQHMMAQQGMSPYGPRGPPGMGPPGINGKDQFQAQHDWYQIQRDFYLEKQHRMQQQMAAAGRGGPMPPHMEPGPPPPSYYSSISQKHAGMKPHMGSGPPSPGSMNGMRMPMGPHGPHGPHMGMEGPDGMGGMYGDMCRGPPHMGMEPMPGMYPPHGMPPQGHMDPSFDPTIPGSMPPGMGPGGGPLRHHGPMRLGHPGHMMGGPNGMMPGGMKPGALPTSVTLHRAGNPEQFNPETMGGVVPPPSSNSSKPPPSYAQAQKRKRGDANDVDDSTGYVKGNLQQTPSPTKIHYHLSQFEGQELTITKQLNTAFVGDDMTTTSSASTTSSSGSSGGPGMNNFNSHCSPLHGPGSNKGPHSNSSQTSIHNSPSVPSGPLGPSPHHHPGPPTPLSSSAPPPSCPGAGMRLSHFDPSGGASLSNGISSAPQTPNPKLSSSSSSTLSNITSASLANLAKGVENLSNQMQQNMMQGGPFHSIQVQGQMTSTGNGSSNSSNNSSASSNNNGSSSCLTTTSATTTSASSSLSSHSSSSLSTSLSSANPALSSSSSLSSSVHPPTASQSPNINMHSNSAYLNSGPGGPGGYPHPMNSYLNMPQTMGPAGCDMPGMTNGPRPPTPMSHHQMAQTQGMLAAAALGPMGNPGTPSPAFQQHSGPHGMGGPPSHQLPMPGPAQHMGPHIGPQPMAGPGMGHHSHHHRHNSSSSLPATPPIMNKPGQFTSPPLSHNQIGMSGVTSPSFPPATTTVTTASSSGPSVQIQQKGQNTIQYLPANPPASTSVSTLSQQHPPVGGSSAGPKPMPEMTDYGMARFPSPMHSGGMGDGKTHPHSSTLQYFPSSSPSGPRGPMSSAMSAAAAMGPEFANQATIAMHQSASMMRSSSIPDLHSMQPLGGGPSPMDSGSMGPMHPGGPSPMIGGPACPDMHSTGPGGSMRPGQSPMRPMHPSMAPPHGGLECVSPIPGMGGYMNNGPTIEQAQAQAQAHAAMMMQGGPQMPTSSPHMPPNGGPSPHLAPHGSSMHNSLPPHNGPIPGHSPHSGPVPGHSPHGGPMPGHSPHGGPMPGHSPHGGPMPGHSPHGGPIPGSMPGQSPHSQMVPCSMQGPSPHCPMPGGPAYPHNSMSGPHGHMAGGPPMHGPAAMPRHPGMRSMMGPGPGMYGAAGGGGMQPGYPGYQPDYYPSGPPQGPPRPMMGPGMMAGPGQPYGMMSNMHGPS